MLALSCTQPVRSSPNFTRVILLSQAAELEVSDSECFDGHSYINLYIYIYICRIESPKWIDCRTFSVECTTMLFNVRLWTH